MTFLSVLHTLVTEAAIRDNTSLIYESLKQYIKEGINKRDVALQLVTSPFLAF